MNIHKLSIPFLLVAAALMVADGARAQIGTQLTEPMTSVDRSFDPAPKDCNEVRWSQAALEAFPSIGEACQAVEERNGKTYVKFEGVVESVQNEGKRIRVDFQDGEALTFTPAPQTVLYLDGERTSFSEVRDGMRLNFYVPEDRLQAELQLDPTRVAFIIFPLDMPTADIAERQQMAGQQSDQAQADRDRTEQSAMTTLPETASPWPLIGGGGVALLVLGMAMSVRRRRNR